MKKSLVVAVVVAGGLLAGGASAQVTPEQFKQLQDQVSKLADENKALTDKIDKLLSKTEKDLAALADQLKDTDKKLADLAKPSGGGAGAGNLLGNMEKDPEVRAQFDKLLTGRLIIDNNSGTDQYLYINGTLWRVVPGKSYAPISRSGVVTVQRLGGGSEVLTDWQFDAKQGYHVSYRLPQSVYTLSPVIIWPY